MQALNSFPPMKSADFTCYFCFSAVFHMPSFLSMIKKGGWACAHPPMKKFCCFRLLRMICRLFFLCGFHFDLRRWKSVPVWFEVGAAFSFSGRSCLNSYSAARCLIRFPADDGSWSGFPFPHRRPVFLICGCFFRFRPGQKRKLFDWGFRSFLGRLISPWGSTPFPFLALT